MQPVDRISSVDFPQTVLKNIECHLPLVKEAGSTLTQGSSASFPYGAAARHTPNGGWWKCSGRQKFDQRGVQEAGLCCNARPNASSHARVHPVNHVLLGLRKHPSH